MQIIQSTSTQSNKFLQSKLTRLAIACLTIFLFVTVPATHAIGQVDFGGFNQDASDEFSVDSEFKIQKGKRTGILTVHVTLADGWHIYSTTQPPGGPLKTQFKIEPSDRYTFGDFKSKTDPLIDDADPAFPDVRIEYFEHEATWYAPIEFAEGVDPTKTKIPVLMKGQRCESGCLQIKENLTAEYAGTIDSGSAEAFQPKQGHVLFSAATSAASVSPGGEIKLTIKAEPQGDYHIYPFSQEPSDDISSNPTLIVFSKLGKWTTTGPETKGELIAEEINGEKTESHPDVVFWEYTLRAPKDLKVGEAELIGGAIGFQTCTASTCDKPHSVKFSVNIPVTASPEEGSLAGEFEDGLPYESVKEDVAKYAETRKQGGAWKDYPAALVFAFAFLAGLILNVMPCVLPVIGIKIMSFVNQAGSKPGRLIFLNVAFTAGIIAVFMVLATLAVFFGFGWGDLYKDVRFTIVMVSVLFVFALSFVGVWEIPIPGFVGTAGGAAQKQEGFFGAFVKGVFSTLLATPCSGPMLVPAVVWAIAQPAWITYLVFFFMGLGMASPYLVLGFMPGLAKMLPRPGAWMETFKILMGFLLLGAVVFFFGSITKKYQSSTLTFMIFLGMACWIVGKISMLDTAGTKFKVWIKAGALSCVGALVAFYFLIPQYELKWERYSKSTLESYLAEGRTVFVDATADWCFTCKTNEFTSFNRKATYDFFEQNNIVALKADNTEESKEIKMLLDGLGNTANGLPYYAIYDPARSEPLHFGSQTFLGPQDFISRIQPGLPKEPSSTIPAVQEVQNSEPRSDKASGNEQNVFSKSPTQVNSGT